MNIGFAAQKITPNLNEFESGLQLGGYAPRQLCSGIHDDLFARAAYFETMVAGAKNSTLLITCDLLSIPHFIAQPVKAAISSRIGIPETQIMISATHTHHGPDLYGTFREGAIGILKGLFFPRPPNRYLVQIAKKLCLVAEKAYEDRKPAQLGAGQIMISSEDRVMMNRRDVFNEAASKYPISVIKVAQEGKLVGIIANYAIHGTVLPRYNTKITADYVGYLIKTLERAHPALKGKCLYFNGPCGEINPLTTELKEKMAKVKSMEELTADDIYDQLGTWADAARIGETVAKYILQLLPSIQCEITETQIQVHSSEVEIPFTPVPLGSGFSQVLQMLGFRIKQRLFKTFIKYGLLKSNIFLKTIHVEQGFVETFLQRIDLGPCSIYTAPGEYFLELAKEVLTENQKNSGRSDRIAFVIELANDSIGYLYTMQAFVEGGYESSFSLIPLGGRLITIALKNLARL